MVAAQDRHQSGRASDSRGCLPWLLQRRSERRRRPLAAQRLPETGQRGLGVRVVRPTVVCCSVRVPYVHSPHNRRLCPQASTPPRIIGALRCRILSLQKGPFSIRSVGGVTTSGRCRVVEKSARSVGCRDLGEAAMGVLYLRSVSARPPRPFSRPQASCLPKATSNPTERINSSALLLSMTPGRRM